MVSKELRTSKSLIWYQKNPNISYTLPFCLVPSTSEQRRSWSSLTYPGDSAKFWNPVFKDIFPFTVQEFPRITSLLNNTAKWLFQKDKDKQKHTLCWLPVSMLKDTTQILYTPSRGRTFFQQAIPGAYSNVIKEKSTQRCT